MRLGINKTNLAVLLALATLLSGCNKSVKDGDIVIVLKQSDGETLAQVGKTKLTIEELRDLFLTQQGSFRGSPNLNTDKARNDFIEAQVLQKAMFIKAVELGYFDRPEVKRDIEKAVVQRLVRDKLEQAQKDFVPTDEQMREHYEKNKNFYNRPEAVKVAFISIPFGTNKAKSKELADLIYKDAVSNVKNSNTREFSRIAMKNAPKVAGLSNTSIETNETDYLDKEEFEKKFGANSFDGVKNQGNLGDIRPLHTTDSAYVIMMKTGARKELNETVEEAKPKIAKRLAYESRNEFYKNFTKALQDEYKITINKERLADLSKDDKPAVAKTDAMPNQATAQHTEKAPEKEEGVNE